MFVVTIHFAIMRDLSHLSVNSICAGALALCTVVSSQALLRPQTNTFGSNATLSAEQIASASLDEVTTNNVQVALNFERTNWANGSVTTEPFYTEVPSNASGAQPGTLLKLQQDANTAAYSLPPSTALSRIMYQTADLNGTAVPATGYILWPYQPRQLQDGSWPVVAWAHGSSSAFAECAPSHVRNLWQQFTTPYALALQGYVVVATDYAGLGVNRSFDGTPILHQHLASLASANDVVYSVLAARSAFPQLSKEFVVAGHSQGAGATWAVAQRQAQQPVDGYLGAIAGAPVTSILRLAESAGAATAPESLLLANYFPSLFPGFKPSDFLQPEGEARGALLAQLSGCNSVALELLSSDVTKLYQPDWQHSEWANIFDKLVSNGGKTIGGPLLVLQGGADQTVHENVTDLAVQETCNAFPTSQIDYRRFNGSVHSSIMFVAQRQVLDWIADRFAHKLVQQSCQTTNFSSARDDAFYQKELNWFLEPALDVYEVA